MPLDSLSAQHGGLDDFRMSSRTEVAAMLKQLLEGNVLINLNGSDGTVYTTTLWTIDTNRGTLSFCADGDSNQVQDLVEAEDAVAVAYLDSIKLQFDAQGLALIRSGTGCVLSCALPREMFRFQRRSAFRVKLLLSEVTNPTRVAPISGRVTGYAGPRKTIIVTDDNPTHRDLIREVLTPLGFIILSAHDAPSCLALAEHCEPDLFILDISMGETDGWTLAQTLRDSGHHRDTGYRRNRARPPAVRHRSGRR